jgi:lipopolysaccharide/colanic/teichoic acid biosynthesis glycosyltransferase
MNATRPVYCIPVETGARPTPAFAWLAEALYRSFEVAVAASVLVACAPLMLLQAIIIKYDSPGTILFFQQRLGKSVQVPGARLRNDERFRAPAGQFAAESMYYRPKTFRFVKFRTMYADARERHPELYDYTYAPDEFLALRFKIEDDPRITPAGRWLRRLTIDELPNFWNVLTGDMRLVGPRPELPEILPCYSPEQMLKLTVKPGITGLAQIRGRGLLSFQETIDYDLEYVRTRTISRDIAILLKTFWYVMVRRGAF